MRYTLQGYPAQEVFHVSLDGVTRSRGHIPPGGAWYTTCASVPTSLGREEAVRLFRRWAALLDDLVNALPATPIRREGALLKARVKGPDGEVYVFQASYLPRSGWGNFQLVTVPHFLPAGAEVWVTVPDPRLG